MRIAGILDGFKIQEDVNMYSQIPEYDDFRCFDSPAETDLVEIRNAPMKDFRSRYGQLLNIIYLGLFISKEFLLAIMEICVTYTGWI